MSLIFHHIGKPVDLKEIQANPDTKYSPLFDMYSLNMGNSLSIPIELHAFGENCTLHPRIQKETHVAFKVPDIEKALTGHKIVMPLYQPFAGYRCAMVIINDQLTYRDNPVRKRNLG